MKWLRSAARSRTLVAVERALVVRFSRACEVRITAVPRVTPARKRGVSVLQRAIAFRALVADPTIGSRAALARHLGVSRAFVTQALAVLDAPPALLNAMHGADGAGRPVTQGVWRAVCRLEPDAALARLSARCS